LHDFLINFSDFRPRRSWYVLPFLGLPCKTHQLHYGSEVPRRCLVHELLQCCLELGHGFALAVLVDDHFLAQGRGEYRCDVQRAFRTALRIAGSSLLKTSRLRRMSVTYSCSKSCWLRFRHFPGVSLGESIGHLLFKFSKATA